MKILAFNGSPRRNGHTATLLQLALFGAAAQGAQTELFHLYDLHFRGCISCLACKRRGGVSYGRCAQRDALTPLLDRVQEADAIILGSPYYVGSHSSTMRAFLERLIYQYVVFEGGTASLFGRKMPTGFIYTIGSSAATLGEAGAAQPIEFLKTAMDVIFGSAETLLLTGTSLYDDSAQTIAAKFNSVEKAREGVDELPPEYRRAFEMGARFSQMDALAPVG